MTDLSPWQVPVRGAREPGQTSAASCRRSLSCRSASLSVRFLAVAGRTCFDLSPLQFETPNRKKFFDMFHLKPTGCVSLAFLLLSILFGCTSAREETDHAGEESAQGPFVLGIWSSPSTHPPWKHWKRRCRRTVAGWTARYLTALNCSASARRKSPF